MRGLIIISDDSGPGGLSSDTVPGKSCHPCRGSDLLSRMKDRLEGPKLHPPQHLLDISGLRI